MKVGHKYHWSKCPMDTYIDITAIEARTKDSLKLHVIYRLKSSNIPIEYETISIPKKELKHWKPYVRKV